MIIWYLMGAFLVVFVPVWFSYEYYQWKTGVPVFPTMPPMRKKIIGALQKEAAAHPGKTLSILDLGSGSGQLSWRIARVMPQAQITGIELSYVPWLRSVIRQRLFGPKNLRYVRANFMPYNISSYDCIVVYVIGAVMGTVSPKLREAKPGALILAPNFPLRGDWTPYETIDTHIPMKVTLSLYRQK